MLCDIVVALFLDLESPAIVDFMRRAYSSRRLVLDQMPEALKQRNL